MKKLNKVRWGIIGCGDVTEVKSGPAFQKIKNSELVAVMRRTGELAKDYATRHNVPKWYDDADLLIADPEVDAIYIATPPAFHKEYTLKAAQAGKPVYVEKPMALNYQECLDMIAAVATGTETSTATETKTETKTKTKTKTETSTATETSNPTASVPLYVAYYRRAQPKFKKIKELLESGVIGEPRLVTTTQYRQATNEEQNQQNLPWRVQPHLAGGGLFFDLASHTLDILDFLLGPIEQVHGFASNLAGFYQAEDIVTGTYLFESGVHGSGNWCFSAFENIDVNEIIGTTGKITFSTFENDPIILTTATGTEQWTIDKPEHVHQPLIETIVAELTGRNGECPSTGHSGARTSWVMDEMVKNYYHK